MDKRDEPRARHTIPRPAVLLISFAAMPSNVDDATARQHERAQHQADELQLRIVHEVVEMGVSATKFKNRLAFKALLNYLDDHPEVRHVMVPSIGRVSRSWRNLQAIMAEFEARNVCVVTFDGQVVPSSDAAGHRKIALFLGHSASEEAAAGSAR